jgi:tetratricopeptide (TPR) repeat protein
MMAERMELSGRELGLLTIVLDFYDGFAEGNETNSQLQGEAARAYRKVAALYRVLGRQPEAEAAQARALERFQSLVRRNGEDSEYSYELARTLALDGPGALEVPSDRAEPDLRRAIAMVEGLFDRAPERKQITYAAALARWKGRLAERLDSLGRTEEAAAAYAASIAHDEWLSGHLNDPWMVRDVLATRRASLAEVLIRLGRKDEARGLVDRVAADVVRNVGEGGRSGRESGERAAISIEALASLCRSLGDDRRAAELDEMARLIREGAREGRPGRRGGGGGFAPNPIDGRGNGRGRTSSSGPVGDRPGR